jgi:hypothetical protein
LRKRKKIKERRKRREKISKNKRKKKKIESNKKSLYSLLCHLYLFSLLLQWHPIGLCTSKNQTKE